MMYKYRSQYGISKVITLDLTFIYSEMDFIPQTALMKLFCSVHEMAKKEQQLNDNRVAGI